MFCFGQFGSSCFTPGNTLSQGSWWWGAGRSVIVASAVLEEMMIGLRRTSYFSICDLLGPRPRRFRRASARRYMAFYLPSARPRLAEEIE